MHHTGCMSICNTRLDPPRSAHLAGGRIVCALSLELLDQRFACRQAALQALHLALRLLRLGLLDLQARGRVARVAVRGHACPGQQAGSRQHTCNTSTCHKRLALLAHSFIHCTAAAHTLASPSASTRRCCSASSFSCAAVSCCCSLPSTTALASLAIFCRSCKQPRRAAQSCDFKTAQQHGSMPAAPAQHLHQVGSTRSERC